MKNLTQIFVKIALCGVVGSEGELRMENRKRNVQIIVLDLQEVKAHTAQLQKIGVNVNQIANRINETGRIYTADMDEVKRLIDEVWRLERRLLLQFKGLTK